MKIILFKSVFIAMFITCCASNIVATELIDAVKAGQYDRIEALIAANVNFNEQDGAEYTALMHAAKNNDAKATSLLLKATKDVETVYAALAVAVECGHVDIVRLLLNANTSTDHMWPIIRFDTIKENKTPLMLAAEKGNVVIMHLLLSCNTRWIDGPSPRDDRGYTALMYAAQAKKHSAQMVRLLLKHDASSAAVKTKNGITAYKLAKQSGNKEAARMLRAQNVKRFFHNVTHPIDTLIGAIGFIPPNCVSSR